MFRMKNASNKAESTWRTRLHPGLPLATFDTDIGTASASYTAEASVTNSFDCMMLPLLYVHGNSAAAIPVRITAYV
jgi:hypothetical protein